jgi:hypothetical protein
MNQDSKRGAYLYMIEPYGQTLGNGQDNSLA